MHAAHWSKVVFTKDDAQSGKWRVVQAGFEKVFNRCYQPHNAVLFTTTDHQICYFSPGAMLIADLLITSWGGVKCDAPKRKGLDILVAGGDVSCLFDSV